MPSLRPLALLLALALTPLAAAHEGAFEREGAMARFPTPAPGQSVGGRVAGGDLDWLRVPLAGGPVTVSLVGPDGAALGFALVATGLPEDAVAELPEGVALAPGEGAVALAADAEGERACELRVCTRTHRLDATPQGDGFLHAVVWSRDGASARYTLVLGDGDAHAGPPVRYLAEPAPGESASAVPDTDLPTPWWAWTGRLALPVALVGGLAVVLGLEVRRRKRARGG